PALPFSSCSYYKDHFYERYEDYSNSHLLSTYKSTNNLRTTGVEPALKTTALIKIATQLLPCDFRINQILHIHFIIIQTIIHTLNPLLDHPHIKVFAINTKFDN